MTKTSLNRSPPYPSYYFDGIVLGTGIDAITGEATKSALDPGFQVKQVTSTGSGDRCNFNFVSSVTDLEESSALGLSSSITFPSDGVEAMHSFDFTSTEQSSVSVVFIVFDWEHQGHTKRCDNVQLSGDACKDLRDNKAGFRKKYGDYFVYQISSMLKFTTVWKCTAETSSQITKFESEMSGSLNLNEVEVSGSFTTKLNNTAKKNNVTLDVKYQLIGDTDSIVYDLSDMPKMFNSFRNTAKPVPYEMLLRHYNVVDSTIPTTIDMDIDVFLSICKVFTTARFVLFLIGMVPGTRSVRIARRNKIDSIFQEIYAKRITFETDPASLQRALDDLQEMRNMLWLRLERQDLVVEMYSLQYGDFIKKFAIDQKDTAGAWVRALKGQETFVLGRVGFNDAEREKYAVASGQVSEVHLGSLLFQQQHGALEFPGSTGINGYIVGLTVQPCWTDGTDGWWCLGKNLRLGTKQAKVDVKTEGSRGMHWKLHAHYIPCSEYDE